MRNQQENLTGRMFSMGKSRVSYSSPTHIVYGNIEKLTNSNGESRKVDSSLPGAVCQEGLEPGQTLACGS
jgi:hypothetical protein